MERIFGRPIVTQEEMHARIRELGKQITTDYTGKDFILVGVLKGAYAFYADLARAIRIPMRVDFLMVTSDGSRTKSSGKVKMVTELTEDGTLFGDTDKRKTYITLEVCFHTFAKPPIDVWKYLATKGLCP